MLKGLLLLLVVLFVIVFIEWMREIHTFRITHYTIESQKLINVKRRKIVLLSDLHNCTYGKENEKLLKAIEKENPDMILIAGDMLVGSKNASTEIAENFVTKLPRICDTYYANGNHEQRMRENRSRYGTTYQKYEKVLVDSGVVLLINNKAELQWEDCSVEIHGLEIPCVGYKKFQKVSLPEQCIEQCLGKVEGFKYHILIAHNPIFMEDYMNWGADLVVSGHLHGGVARIPGWRGVITPQGSLFPKYSGEMTKIGDATAVVSKGIGIHTIKIRFLNPAEVVVLHVGNSEE